MLEAYLTSASSLDVKVESKEFTMIGKSIALNFPNSLEYYDMSYLGDLRDSGNSINVSANNLQFFDLTGSYFFDCNYKWVNLLLDNSIYCNDLKPRKKAPCLSEPINPIPSDAFFITKRSTFLNVLQSNTYVHAS
jgi:hypothetical protein